MSTTGGSVYRCVAALANGERCPNPSTLQRRWGGLVCEDHADLERENVWHHPRLRD